MFLASGHRSFLFEVAVPGPPALTPVPCEFFAERHDAVGAEMRTDQKYSFYKNKGAFINRQ